ncbi:hypothetical protein MBLNU13_g01053t1 [Cladosporium sp. NU13]
MSGSGLFVSNFELYYNVDANMAYSGNTAVNISLPSLDHSQLQTWSRNELGWLESSYSPSGAMTQVVYSTTTTTTSETTTSTETEMQTIIWPESYTITETTTETDWSTTATTKTTTELSTTTEFATTACDPESSTTHTPTTSSGSSAGPTSEPSPSPDPKPDPEPPSPPPPREYWSPQLSVDAMIFTYWDDVGAGIVSDDAKPTFFPVSGGQLCANSQRTGQ